jgi:antitoxin (DNA-binding transcriptional repressor) of toxin-antitoxin stability system
VDRARFGRERVILTEHGTPVAAIIPGGEPAELQAATDAADQADSAEAAVDLLAPHAAVLAAAEAAAGSGQRSGPLTDHTLIWPPELSTRSTTPGTLFTSSPPARSVDSVRPYPGGRP